MSFAFKDGEEETETGREWADEGADGVVTERGPFYNPKSL